MNVYVVHYVFLCIISLLYNSISDKKIKNILFGICCASLLFLTVFRDVSVGADTQNYCDGFQYIRKSLPWRKLFSWGWEPGYVALNKVIGIFFRENQALIIILGILILCSIFLMIKRNSSLPCMSLVVFVALGIWNSSTFIYRQWCAIIILLLSLNYVRKRKFIPFIFMIFCAMMFHRTAIVFVMVYFVYYLKIKTNTIVGLLLCSIVLGACGKPIFKILNQFARMPILGEYNGGVNLLIFMWFCVFIIFFLNKIEIKKDKYKIYYSMLLIAATLQPIVFTFSLWSRVVFYFFLSIIILLPNLFNKVLNCKENIRLKIPMEILFYAFFYFYYRFSGIGEYSFMKM